MNEIPAPAKVIAERKRSAAQPQPNTVGWWSLRDKRGSPENVAAAVDAAADVPDWWKAALKAEITDRCKEFNFVYLDAHFFIESGKANLHVTIEPDKVL